MWQSILLRSEIMKNKTYMCLLRSESGAFRTKSVMGRFWDDHFGQLGYLPKFDGVQDARFTSNSSNG